MVTNTAFSRTNNSVEKPHEIIINLEGIHKEYQVNNKPLKVFENLSLDITKGDFFSIVGPSGCGKSTLLKMIAGLEKSTKGEITFNNNKVNGPPRGMIYVFQQYTKSIFPWYTVIQNIKFGLESQQKLSKEECKRKCMEYIKLVGLEGYEDYFPYQLSGGMQQRVVIARALIGEPDVILMDEPFSAVDAMTRAILQELVLEIWEKIKITILFVTHDIEEAVFLSNKIISLGQSPTGIKENIPINLPYPRDQIETRKDPEFNSIYYRIFTGIFEHEKKIEGDNTIGKEDK